MAWEAIHLAVLEAATSFELEQVAMIYVKGNNDGRTGIAGA